MGTSSGEMESARSASALAVSQPAMRSALAVSHSTSLGEGADALATELVAEPTIQAAGRGAAMAGALGRGAADGAIMAALLAAAAACGSPFSAPSMPLTCLDRSDPCRSEAPCRMEDWRSRR